MDPRRDLQRKGKKDRERAAQASRKGIGELE
jgi:hypothetical protein